MARLKGIKFFVLLAVTVSISMLATPTGATVLTWTDMGTYAASAEGLNPITYTLEFEDPVSGTYSATFTIEITASDPGGTEWRAGWVAFKFGPFGDTFSLTNFTTTAPGSWEVGVASTTVPNNQTPFDGQFVGFYSKELNIPDPVLGAKGGVLLTGGPAEYVFNFDFSGTGNVFTDEMPFHVGLYDALTGQPPKPDNRRVITDKVSEKLVGVPEPSTLLLLGAGLVGFGILARRKFRS